MLNALRWCVGCPWRLLPHDLPPWPAVRQQTQRWARGLLCASGGGLLRRLLHLGAGHAASHSRIQRDLAQAVQAATGERVLLAYVDRGCTGERPASPAS